MNLVSVKTYDVEFEKLMTYKAIRHHQSGLN